MFWEKKGLEFLLNVSRVAARLVSVDRAFHRQGLLNWKLFHQFEYEYTAHRVQKFVAERRLVWRWSEETGCSMSEMYAGAVLFSDRYASTHILNSIRAATGSQCKSISAVVTSELHDSWPDTRVGSGRVRKFARKDGSGRVQFGQSAT